MSTTMPTDDDDGTSSTNTQWYKVESIFIHASTFGFTLALIIDFCHTLEDMSTYTILDDFRQTHI